MCDLRAAKAALDDRHRRHIVGQRRPEPEIAPANEKHGIGGRRVGDIAALKRRDLSIPVVRSAGRKQHIEEKGEKRDAGNPERNTERYEPTPHRQPPIMMLPARRPIMPDQRDGTMTILPLTFRAAMSFSACAVSSSL